MSDADDEFELSDGVVLRGANACNIARRAWARPKPKRQELQSKGLLQFCRPRDHQFLYKGGKIVNGKWTVHYQCERCGFKVTI